MKHLEADWLTVSAAAEIVKVNDETVRRWIRTGELKAFALGGPKSGYRIRRDELEAFIEGRYGTIKRSQMDI